MNLVEGQLAQIHYHQGFQRGCHPVRLDPLIALIVIELAIIQSLSKTTVMIYLEPKEDPISWIDQGLDRI
ncbi:hypothetical protein CFPU101_15940 [Chroococcus sp. FPU101]|nr:hypothetical protein CFPU101_15940 [Chroococcus sp. FPU101]